MNSSGATFRSWSHSPAGDQAAIGRVHHETEPALALLLAEGFAVIPEVDIFDGGPLLRASADSIRTIREARLVTVRSAAANIPATHPPLLLSNGALDFRACLGPVLAHDDGSVAGAPSTATALNRDPGDKMGIALPKEN